MIKKDPAMLIAYNNRAKQMRNETEKLTKSRNDQHDPLVACIVEHEEMMTGRSGKKKKIQTQPKKAPNSLEFVQTDPKNSMIIRKKNLR